MAKVKDLDKLISQMVQIKKFVSQMSDQTFEEHAATFLQYHTLAFLEKNPKAKLGDVAQNLNASLSSTTQLVERMHKGGLIEREGDENDRRVTHLSATENGLDKLKFLKESKRERMSKLLSHISQKDVTDLIRIQQKLLDSIKKNK